LSGFSRTSRVDSILARRLASVTRATVSRLKDTPMKTPPRVAIASGARLDVVDPPHAAWSWAALRARLRTSVRAIRWMLRERREDDGLDDGSHWK
jgi:hypothetical protein